MPSQSRQKFLENQKDIQRLLAIHTDLAGEEPGRKWGMEVLNKSAVILICATWEAYVEDIAQEGVAHICAHCPDPTRVPLSLQRTIADDLKQQTSGNPVAAWKLAGIGWQNELRNNLTRIQAMLVANWNTPKTANVDMLIEKSIGLASISSTWHRKSLTVDKARAHLDYYVTLRGAIAHRLHPDEPVNKWHATRFLQHVNYLVEFSDAAVNVHMEKSIGRPLF